MNIQNHFGEWVICGEVFPAEFICPGQLWQGSSGSVVIVESVRDNWVVYSWIERGAKVVHSKDCFSFQCRYCLIVDGPDSKFPINTRII